MRVDSDFARLLLTVVCCRVRPSSPSACLTLMADYDLTQEDYERDIRSPSFDHLPASVSNTPSNVENSFSQGDEYPPSTGSILETPTPSNASTSAAEKSIKCMLRVTV